MEYGNNKDNHIDSSSFHVLCQASHEKCDCERPGAIISNFALSSTPTLTRPIWRTERSCILLLSCGRFSPREKGKYERIMRQNDERDSSSNSPVEDTSPHDSDEEEEKVVSIMCVFLHVLSKVDLLTFLFESVVCRFSFPGLLNLLHFHFLCRNVWKKASIFQVYTKSCSLLT